MFRAVPGVCYAGLIIMNWMIYRVKIGRSNLNSVFSLIVSKDLLTF